MLQRAGDRASSASSLARATPRATKPSPVRVHERKVRSLARWSLATLPVLAIGVELRYLRMRDILMGLNWLAGNRREVNAKDQMRPMPKGWITSSRRSTRSHEPYAVVDVVEKTHLKSPK